MGITLKDIAKHANVSMSTVSRVINQKGTISEETTQLVEQAIAELMYKPTTVSLRLSNQQRKIAIIAPGNPNRESEGGRLGVDANALIAAVESKGHIPVVSTIQHDSDTSYSSVLEMIRKKQVDGVIICDNCNGDQTKVDCKASEVPYLCTNGISYAGNESFVDYDNADGAFQAIRYLHELGHQKIGVISGPESHEITQNRLYGVYLAIEKLGLDESDFTTVFSEYTIEGGEQATLELLAQSNVTAIFALSDRLAVSAMTTLRAKNIQVPEDISIIGFDDVELCKLVYPPLTTIKRYSDEISPCIVDSLLRLIESPQIKKLQILYDTSLVIRESCAKR